MVFRIIAIVSIPGLLARLSYLRFIRKLVTSAITPNKPLVLVYFSWLGQRVSALFRPPTWAAVQSIAKKWFDSYPQAWMRWAVAGLVVSYAYLGASGLAFAVFTTRGIFGLPLLLHVIAGGIFAVCLAVILVFRARKYVFLTDKTGPADLSAVASSWTFSAFRTQSVLFWLFIISGLFLVATALFSMLPYFSYQAQLSLVGTHRYSALVSLLTAVIFLDKALLRQQK
jgi:hypothetical protein